MGGKGVEPLRTFVHTVLSRARLPFRHPPITRYIIENFLNSCQFFYSLVNYPQKPARARAKNEFYF